MLAMLRFLFMFMVDLSKQDLVLMKFAMVKP